MQYFFILRFLITEVVAAHPTPSAYHQEADTNTGISALGHKRTFREARAMSALPPIADMKWQFAPAEPECRFEAKNVRFAPKSGHYVSQAKNRNLRGDVPEVMKAFGRRLECPRTTRRQGSLEYS
jgi:hypothetical protein